MKRVNLRVGVYGWVPMDVWVVAVRLGVYGCACAVWPCVWVPMFPYVCLCLQTQHTTWSEIPCQQVIPYPQIMCMDAPRT